FPRGGVSAELVRVWEQVALCGFPFDTEPSEELRISHRLLKGLPATEPSIGQNLGDLEDVLALWNRDTNFLCLLLACELLQDFPRRHRGSERVGASGGLACGALMEDENLEEVCFVGLD